MTTVEWRGDEIGKSTKQKAMEGLLEWCHGVWTPAAVANCPVDKGTMRESLGVEAHPEDFFAYVGGGGAAESYIMKQELDESLSHTVGKAHFIMGAIQDNSGQAEEIIKKHTDR